MIYSLMHGWDGVFRDEENNEMEQGKRWGDGLGDGWDDGWDGELINK